MKNHLSLRLYPNKDYVINVVSDANLASHIEYNKIYRFGCLKEDYLKEYDEYTSNLLKTLDIDLTKETTPFW